MEIICLKWGDKFSHKHVNRLYKMVSKNYQDEFHFVCYTENKTQINHNIEIRPINLDYDLEKWWWKLTLFERTSEKPRMFLDLDVVIQNDITHFKKYCRQDKICTVKAWWKPHARDLEPEPPGYNMDLNSSIMIWKGDMTNVWKEFYDDYNYFLLKYKGIDSYLYFHHYEKLNFLSRGEVYSRLYGIDENNYDRAGLSNHQKFRDDSYSICLFNGWRGKINRDTGKYALDDDDYIGFEEFWK